MMEAFSQTLIRLMLAIPGGIVAVILLAISGMPYGSSGNGMMTFALAAFFVLIAWSMFPAIRRYRLFGILFGLLWLGLGFATSSAIESIAGAWLMATFAAIVCMACRPPSYFGGPAASDQPTK